MQVDFVITELNVGGAEQALARIACGLAESGDDVRVFSCGPLPTGEDAISGVSELHRLNSDRIVAQLRASQIEITSGAGASWEFPRVARELKRWLNRRPSALCQTFLVHANILGQWAARHRIAANGSAPGPTVAGIRVAESKWLRLGLERQALRQANHVVCVSEGVAEFTREHLRVPTSKLTVIPNSVELERFANASPLDWTTIGFPANAQVILFVGRLHAQKNLELLRDHIDAILPIDSGRRLCLVGDGPLASSMQQWAAGVSGNRVRVLPWQTDIAPMMAACEVLILPSRYEGMPNVVLEAMSAGKPVVVSNVEGVAELVAHAPQQSFQPGNVTEMLDRLNWLLNDPQAAERIGQANQDKMGRDYSIPVMVQRYRDLYKRLIDRHA